MPGPRLRVRERKTEVDRESLLQPIMSVICPQIEERGDKERPADTTHSAHLALVCVCLYSCVCVISSAALQLPSLAAGLTLIEVVHKLYTVPTP